MKLTNNLDGSIVTEITETHHTQGYCKDNQKHSYLQHNNTKQNDNTVTVYVTAQTKTTDKNNYIN